MIPDINFHMTPHCNMSCKFCFAQFKGISELNEAEALSLVQLVSDYGFEKINFVGGEPTLVPWLKNALKRAHDMGLTTSIITNGWNLDSNWLKGHAEYLDWIGLSIDSLCENTNNELGRKTSRCKLPNIETYLNSIKHVHEYDLKLKINTVVTQLNKNESFHDLITKATPDKWKIFQVLIIENQNKEAKELSITKNEFNNFLSKHEDLSTITEVYPEYNEDMMNSYLIIDPSGRFVDNSQRSYSYSESIINVGLSKALSQINISTEKYTIRKNPNRISKLFSKNKTDSGGPQNH